MPRKTRYFSRDGRELSAGEALDARGIVRSGVITRVPMTMADGARPGFHYPRQHFTVTDARQYWDRNKDTLICTDVRRIGGIEGSKPGFRVLDNDLGRAAKDAALRDHERYLNDAWRGKRDAEVEEEDGDDDRKECPACDGSGYDANGEQCARCRGTGEVPDADNGDEEAEAIADAKRRRRRSEPEPDGDDDDDPPFGSQDRRTVDQIAADHRRNMAKIYDAYARELSEAWKGGGK